MKDCTNNFKNWDVCVETPLGTIIARPDSEEPGIWVDLRRPDAVDDMELAFIGYSEGSKSPVFEKENEQQPGNRYEQFKLRWMLDHGYNLFDLIRELTCLQADMEPGASIEEVFAEWEHSSGFGSEIWPCFDEYSGCEGRSDPVAKREGPHISVTLYNREEDEKEKVVYSNEIEKFF